MTLDERDALTAQAASAARACQRWQDRRHSWRYPGDRGFDPAAFAVELIPESVAAAFVRRHHYSGSFPVARFCCGLLTDDAAMAGPDATVHAGRLLVGVAVFSVPMSRNVLTGVFPTLAPYEQSLELGRFVLTDPCPANTESWALGQAFALVAAAGVRGVVAFSDPVPRRRELVEVDEATGAVRTTHEQVLPGPYVLSPTSVLRELLLLGLRHRAAVGG